MPIANSTYSRGRQAKIKGKADAAARDKSKYSKSKFTIKFSKNKLEFEKTRTFN